MNSAELAALLASTHPHLSGPQPSVQHSKNTSDPTPLSPRQLFQSRVRTLSDAPTNPQSSPNRARGGGELQRLSTLRVHVTSPRTAQRGAPPHNSHAYHTRDGRFGFTPHEPDFIVEERAAWTGASVERVGEPDHTTPNAWHGRDDESLRLSQDSDTLTENTESLHLQAFAPSLSAPDLDERPKTSRGSSMPGTFPHSQPELSANDTPLRKSKFVEGSMNHRSEGISSTWDQHGERLSTDNSRSPLAHDSDSTPRAAHMSSESLNAEDLSEFRPATASATAATFRQRLSRLANPFKPSEEPTKGTEEVEKQPKKKRLRKSISSWNFHTFGEKVKFFGASAGDSSGSSNHASQPGTTEQLDVLTERKRKAEEAYAEQFGTKKQKTNYGISAEDRNRTIRAPSRTLKKRTPSAQRTPTAHRQHNVSASSVASVHNDADTDKLESADLRKRPSRRELEKENQQLRVLLREQQAQSRASLQLSASRSSLHLPLDEQHEVAGKPQATQATKPPTATAEPRPRRMQKRRENPGIPPVPPLPTREILATLGNKAPTDPDSIQRMKNTAAKEGAGTVRRVTRSMKTKPPREEDGENIRPEEGSSLPREEWEWPEDVF